MSEDNERGEWVFAFTLGGEVTPEQRARNGELIRRMREGIPDDERTGLRGGPLHRFRYEVPSEIVSLSPPCWQYPHGSHSFTLRPDDECFHRLLNCISDAFFNSCDADVEAARLRDENAKLRAEIELLRSR